MTARRGVAVCLAVLVAGAAFALVCDLSRGESADAAVSMVRPLPEISRASGSESVTDPSAIGRFQIICGPLSRQDVYLLDTTNGNTWQMMTDPASGKQWWSPVSQR